MACLTAPNSTLSSTHNGNIDAQPGSSSDTGRVFRHRAWVEDISIEAPAGPPRTYSIVPRRIVLDQILIDRAVECGAEVQQRARVDGLLVESGAVVGAIVQHIGGERREVRARVVVGADGKQSQIAEWVGAEKYDERPVGRPIYYGSSTGSRLLRGRPSRYFLARTESISVCRCDRTSIALSLKRSTKTFRASGRIPPGGSATNFQTCLAWRSASSTPNSRVECSVRAEWKTSSASRTVRVGR